MGKKAVGIDVDGVLADTISVWLNDIEGKFGIRAMKRDMIRYELHEILPGMTQRYVFDSWREVWEDYKRIRLEDPDIPSIVDNLHEKFEIYITTANPSPRIKDWLRENSIAYDKFVHFSSHNDKHELDGVGIYIDDFHEVIRNVAGCGKKAVILRQPWNDEFIKANKDPNVLVAYNWREIEDILLEEV